MSVIANNNTSSKATLSIHDPEFKNLITVPLSAVHHMPPSHLEISRLVLCRKYDPRDPARSCQMGSQCKFVHIDMSTPQLQVQSIHVNYAYRSLSEVTHERLPSGETLAIMAPNNRAPSQLVPSEMILVTRGAIQRHNAKGPLSHCAHYFYNRMCNRGERCGFIHALYIDENATEFQRAPPRAGASCTVSTAQKQVQMPVPPPAAAMPRRDAHHVAVPVLPKPSMAVTSSQASSNDLSESPRSDTESLGHSYYSNGMMRSVTPSSSSSSPSVATRKAYRHNPYSLIETTLLVEITV